MSGRRQRLENGVEILGESHVEHFVGFVENHHLDIAQFECFFADVVKRAARGRHDDVSSASQGVDLSADGLAAVDRDALGSELVAVLVDGFAHLHREFTSGDEDEGRGRRLRS